MFQKLKFITFTYNKPISLNKNHFQKHSEDFGTFRGPIIISNYKTFLSSICNFCQKIQLILIHKRNSITELTLFAGNGCKFLSLYSANIVGSLNLTSKSKLKYLELTSCNVNNVLLSVGISESAIFETLLASCYYLEKLSLASLSITPNMITGSILHNQL